MNVLGAERIAHRVRAVEDPTLVTEGVALDVCPTSNVRLGVYPSLSEYPLTRLKANYRAELDALKVVHLPP